MEKLLINRTADIHETLRECEGIKKDVRRFDSVSDPK